MASDTPVPGLPIAWVGDGTPNANWWYTDRLPNGKKAPTSIFGPVKFDGASPTGQLPPGFRNTYDQPSPSPAGLLGLKKAAK